MSRPKKKGFTLVELVVVLVIMTVILGIAIPSVLHYMKMAEFRKNEENAKTVYLAAESKLTYYRSSGQWEEFKKEVQAAFPNHEIVLNPLSLSIACHIGPGALAVTATKAIEVDA